MITCGRDCRTLPGRAALTRSAVVSRVIQPKRRCRGRARVRTDWWRMSGDARFWPCWLEWERQDDADDSVDPRIRRARYHRVDHQACPSRFRYRSAWEGFV